MARLTTLRRNFSGLRAGAAAIIAGLLCAIPPPAPALGADLDAQLQEIRTLLREKRYPLALESLRFTARQIQELRAEEIKPFFPDAPSGWTASLPISLLDEGEVWSNRIEARRNYLKDGGGAKIELTIDLHSPLIPAVALGFNPLFVAADPSLKLIEIGAEKAQLHVNPDTGEGVLRILVGGEILVHLSGRGLGSPDALIDLARRIDLTSLRTHGGR